MGVSIAYMGKLSAPELVPELIADLTAKARTAQWTCKTMEELRAAGIVTATGLTGLSLYLHKECEPLRFHFDEEGVFTNHTYHALTQNSELAQQMLDAISESSAHVRPRKPEPRKRRREPRPDPRETEFFKEGARYNWTKTQFAGPEVHVTVCAILRHVKDCYAPDLEITDDSGYFATGDYARLEAEIGYVDKIRFLTIQSFEGLVASKQPVTLAALLATLQHDLSHAADKLH